jgi:uncharacterized protein YggT (Ycf19 family)
MPLRARSAWHATATGSAPEALPGSAEGGLMSRDYNDPMPPLQAEQPVQPVQPVQHVQHVQPVQPVEPVESADPVVVVRENRTARVVYLILGILETLLLIRLLLRLFAANPDAWFTQFIYGLTWPFVMPFQGVFAEPGLRGSVLEFSTILAMIVYALLAWVILAIIRIVRDRRSAPTA